MGYKPTFGLKLTILLSFTIMHGFPDMKPKVGSFSPEQLPSQDLAKRQAIFCPFSVERSLYVPWVIGPAQQKDPLNMEI